MASSTTELVTVAWNPEKRTEWKRSLGVGAGGVTE